MRIRTLLLIFASIFFITSCGDKKEVSVANPLSPKVAFDSLISHVERTGDFINSPNVPAMINATALYSMIDSNIMIIDMRNADEFALAHIPNSYNVSFNQILNYFETKINPNSFKRIVLVCNAGQTASYATSILRLLGYDNVFALKWGFSSWHKPTADIRWLSRISNEYSELLENSPNIKNPQGEYPEIESSQKYGIAILRERAHLLFEQGFNPITIKADTLFEAGKIFYIINYWPEQQFNKGHIPGAIQYQPKKSLKRSEQLGTLPTDKPIAVYCFTGQHSSFVVAYLRLLGYDARTLTYGANSFMNGFMQKMDISNVFTEKEIFDLPVSSGGIVSKPTEKEEIIVAPRGGC